MRDVSAGGQIAIIGLGYVGCVTAACFARLGYTVVGVDKDEYKVEAVSRGRSPFYEPGLEESVRDGVTAGQLHATTSMAKALSGASVAMICVGTPSERNGNLDLRQIRRVSEEIGGLLVERTKPLIVAVRSTVYPGTCENVVLTAMQESPLAQVVMNPEFLREGVAMRDFMEPSLLVVGGEIRAAQSVAALYGQLPVEPCIVSLRTAELIKYACNAFHAIKIGFANEIGALAARLGIDGQEVMTTLCKDRKLNMSAAYLRPGFAFGGSCLPKDLRALNYRAARLDLDLPLLRSVLPSNEDHLNRDIQTILDLPSERLGIFGLAFKENTDDLRESPVVRLIEQLIGKGRTLRVFDPHIQLDALYGSNRNFILSAVPHIGRLMERSLDDLLGWADTVVLTQKPSEICADCLSASELPILDLTRGASVAPSFALHS
jgi:GDP-mannose 6-dehydrogenase